MVTLAPETAAPLGSFTMPAMAPVSFWLKAGQQIMTSRQMRERERLAVRAQNEERKAVYNSESPVMGPPAIKAWMMAEIVSGDTNPQGVSFHLSPLATPRP